MKKTLLLSVMILAVVALQAQTVKKLNPTPALAKGLQIVKAEPGPTGTSNVPYKPYKTYPANNKDIQALTKVQFASSANPYSILLEQQNCLTYNDDLGLLMFTHRQTHTNPGNSGYIQATFSADGGSTWDYNILYPSSNNKLGRYPCGIIYNPPGNTNVDDAIAVVAGPYTEGAGWLGGFYASMKFDSTAGDIKQIDDTDPNFLPRMFMNIDNQGTIRLYGEKNTDDGTYYTSYTTAIMTGVFNSGTETWDWTQTTMVPDFIDYQGFPKGYRSPGMAWSSDGQTGYMVYVGRNSDAVDPLGYHPVIYKTTDGGTTWNKMPGFDWSAIPAIDAELVPVTGPSGIKRASFSLIDDAIVDANGKLHFACMINSAYSESNPDSLGYYWAYANINGLIYHVWETATGWDAGVIDIVYASDVDETVTPIPDATWGYRLQMSKSPAEDLIVFAWSDTDTLISDANLAPDILAQVFDINTGGRTATKNITAPTPYYSDNYFMYLSDWCGYDAVNDEIILHMTTSSYGTTDLDPVYHSYLQDARILANISEFSSVSNGTLVVSQNYPNPFNESTSIDITLKKASDVNLEVYNMMGQKIAESTYQLVAGNHTVQLSGQNLSSGIYFYTVRAAEGTVTKKMIVK